MNIHFLILQTLLKVFCSVELKVLNYLLAKHFYNVSELQGLLFCTIETFDRVPINTIDTFVQDITFERMIHF